MDPWTRYLFEQHPESQIRNWVSRLRLFRFFRAFGGYANDGDALEVAFAYSGLDQLAINLKMLGIELHHFDTEPPQPQVGLAYPATTFAQFPSLIAGTKWIEQPGRCDIAGVEVFVWCSQSGVKIAIRDGYAVTEKNVADAELIEKMLAEMTLTRIDPPQDTRHYVCPKYYPTYFDS